MQPPEQMGCLGMKLVVVVALVQAGVLKWMEELFAQTEILVQAGVLQMTPPPEELGTTLQQAAGLQPTAVSQEPVAILVREAAMRSMEVLAGLVTSAKLAAELASMVGLVVLGGRSLTVQGIRREPAGILPVGPAD
jgi:hypothetical protein